MFRFPIALLSAAVVCGGLDRARAGVAVTEIRANGVAFASEALEAGRGPLRIGPGTRDLQFRFGPDPHEGPRAQRLRFKLEGFDRAWRESGGAMRIALRFYDRNRNVVGAHERAVTAQSPGWRGAIGSSTFTERHEEAVVPARAEWLGLYAVTGGVANTVGMFAFEGVTLRTQPGDQNPPRIETLGVEPGKDLEQNLGVPERWQREGSRPEMAQVWQLAAPVPRPVLVLADDEMESYAAWATPGGQLVRVAAGERVAAEWREAYSIGLGGPATAKYRDLAPGNYWFRVAAVTPSGEPGGEEITLPLIVLPPMWQRAWFWAALTLGAAGLSAWLVRRAMQRRMQRRVEQIERQSLLESERARIARDIHDDLGANLAEIAMLSELAQDDLPEREPVRAQLNEIFLRAQGTARRLDEIVWAINPANDSIEHLAGYLGKFAQDHLALARIRCRLDVPETLPSAPITSTQRHHLFLAAKEALHNAVKHGAPTEVAVRMAVEERRLIVTIEDNGAGFTDSTATQAHRGSANMRQRLEQIGGTFERRSAPGGGTTVTFTLPLP
jgi:signal transduction histidine kinase